MPTKSLVVSTSLATLAKGSGDRMLEWHECLTVCCGSIHGASLTNEHKYEDIMRAKRENGALHRMLSLSLTLFDINNIINIVMGANINSLILRRPRERF